MHRQFLLSKIFIIILCILLVILHVNTIYASQIVEGFQYVDAFKITYGLDFMNDVLLVSEYILVFLGIFIGLILANPSNQALSMYSVFCKTSKIKFYTSRLLTGFMMILLISSLNAYITYVFTSRFTPYVLSSSLYTKQFIYIFIQAFQYYLITLMLMGIINHFLMGLLSLVIFWIYEVLYPSLPTYVSKITSVILINTNGLIKNNNKLEIYVSLYIFLTISYIIFMARKDC